MALSPSSDIAGSGRRQSLTPTATEFTPKIIEAKREVLHASFITQTIPNAHRYAGIVGLCTVPEDKAGMNDLGWHITDFLAFRALLCGDNPPRAQTWLALCDIPALVEANSERYAHGKDRRLVGSAARPAKHQVQGGLIKREDDIQVAMSSESLKVNFISAVKQKLDIAMKMQYPLLLIVCGITSPEQHIYFGTIEAENQYTLQDLRSELGDGINHIEATIVTPSLFSAGWQVNASFGGQPSAQVRGGWCEFLARQFGGLFAQNLCETFVGWNCPALDGTKVKPSVRTERFPGPACPSDEVKKLVSRLLIKIQSCLVGGLSASHMDHSFSFSKDNDEWERLIRNRERPLHYRPLDWYERKWAKLPTAQVLENTDNGYEYLGTAFGGTRESQLNHIKYLIRESYLAWPDHWASNFGEETKEAFERFMNKEQPDDLDCHEIFNILEHRARQSIVADAVVQYFDLPMPHNQRSRDWDHYKWKQELSETDRSSLIKYFGVVLGCVPGPNLPPGINQNSMSKLQRRLESGANYVRAALGIRFLTSKDSSEAAMSRIKNFLQEVQLKQAELLISDKDVYLLCCKWLSAIGMPIREHKNAVGAMRVSQGIKTPEDAVDVLDVEDEYVVYQDEEEAQPGDTASFTVAGHTTDEYAPGQQLSFTPFGLFVPVQQQGTVAAAAEEPPEGDYLQQKPWVTPEIRIASPPIVVTQAPEDEKINFSQEEVDYNAEETRIITALHTTTDREEREKLTKELLQLLQSGRNRSLPDAKHSKNVVQNSASSENDKETIAATSSTEIKDGWHNGGETQPETSGHTAPTHMPQPSIQKPQGLDATPPPHKWAERSVGATNRDAPQSPVQIQETTGRKIPPHLRGLSKRRD